MLKLRVRHFTDTGNKGRVIKTARGTISVTDKENGAAALSFSVAAADADGLTQPLFRVAVEYAIGDGPYKPISRNNIFLVQQLSSDEAAAQDIITYDGETYAFAMLPKHWVIVNERTKDGKRSYHDTAGNPVSAGLIVREELDESKAAGWAPDITQNYNGTVDSFGNPWQASDKMKFDINVPTQQHKLIEALVNQGMCEVDTWGLEFRVFRPGTTRNKTHVALGGPGVKRIPIKIDGSEKYSSLLVHMDDENKTTFGYAVPNADTRFGTTHMMLTLSGVSDRATANKLAEAAAAEAGSFKTEIAYEWTPDRADSYFPWEHFHVGDTVIGNSKAGKQELRVIGLVVQEEGDAASARAILGDRISSRNTKLLNRLASVSVGGVIGGTGTSFPAQPPKPYVAPDAPPGLLVVSNIGEWKADGSSKTTVVLSWGAVTSAVDESQIDIAEYEVWSRLPSEVRQRDLAVFGTSTTASVETWEPGVERLVSVRARSTKGTWSDFSLELSVTPEMAGELTPKAPTSLVVNSNVGSWTVAGPVANVAIGWAAVTQTTSDEPVVISEYEVRSGNASVLTTPTNSATISIPSGVSAEIRVRARSNSGAWGDLSEAITVTGSTPSVVSLVPSDPILKTGFGSVIAEWDGTFVSGSLSAAMGVQAYYQNSVGDWVPFGVVMRERGSAAIAGAVGESINVRFDAIDKAGRTSGSSGVVLVVVAEIDGDDIIAGTITGNKIVAGSIEVDQLSPNVGDQLNISANGSVQIIVGRQDEQDVAIEDISNAANQAGTDATSAAIAAADAKAQADVAAGQALVAQQQAQDVGDRFTAHQAVFRVTEFGAEVASRDGSNVLAMTPTGVQIIQGGTAASTWDAGRFIVNEAIVNRAQIGNHLIEKSGTTRTIFRPI